MKKDKKFCLKALKLGARFKDVGLFEDDDLVFKAAKNGDIPNHLYPKRYSQNKEYIKLIVSGTDNKNGTNNTNQKGKPITCYGCGELGYLQCKAVAGSPGAHRPTIRAVCLVAFPDKAVPCVYLTIFVTYW